MTEQEIIEIINSSLAKEFELDPEQMVPEASFRDDLELDSLDAVDMVIVLEMAFNFKIGKDEAIQDIRTLQNLYDFVIEKKNSLDM